MKLIEWLLSLFKRPEVAPQLLVTGSAGLRLIEYYEGVELKAYQDPVGIWTIGFGDTKNVMPGMIISIEEARERLYSRLAAEFEPGVRTALKREPTQKQFDAMVSFTYNLGVDAFKGSTLLRKFNAGDIKGAAAEFERWHYAGGKSLLGLRRRRLAEKLVFLGMEVEPAINTAKGAQ